MVVLCYITSLYCARLIRVYEVGQHGRQFNGKCLGYDLIVNVQQGDGAVVFNISGKIGVFQK